MTSYDFLLVAEFQHFMYSFTQNKGLKQSILDILTLSWDCFRQRTAPKMKKKKKLAVKGFMHAAMGTILLFHKLEAPLISVSAS